MKKIIGLATLLMFSMMVQAANYTEGTDYKRVSPQETGTGDKIEVLEFFWYGCPHCYSFEPHIKKWNKDKPANAAFVRVPAIFRPDWEVQARAYYALSNMGVIEEMHGKIFDAIHKSKKRLNKKELIVDFVEQNGIDRKKFLEEYDSFGVDAMVRKARKKQQAYRIEGVPSVIVNGKYLVSGNMAGTYGNMIKIIDYLVEKESK